jgi:hypothetical protein
VVVDLLHGFVVHSLKQLRLIPGRILLDLGKDSLAPIGRPCQQLLHGEFGWDHERKEEGGLISSAYNRWRRCFAMRKCSLSPLSPSGMSW